MNYRHLYHAGNFGDVLKHAVLSLLLRALRRKETPFCYLETHAGAGRYDLLCDAAQKTGEYRQGIAHLWGLSPVAEDLAAYLDAYLDAVRSVNQGGELRFYPGSPRIARFLMRPQDRMVLMDLHPEELAALKSEFAGDRQVAIHHQDGYAGLKALLPPKERRGLVLIDPPFERPDEWEQALSGLKLALGRWPTGIYAVWYPIKDRRSVQRWQRRMVQIGSAKILLAELSVYPEDVPQRLNGCGMLIVNPPWQLDERLKGLLPRLLALLAVGEGGSARVQWLVPESAAQR